MAQKDTLAKNTILLTIGTFMTKGLTFILVPIFSRWLTTEDYGTFDLVCTYVSLLIPLIGLSSNEALFRFSMDEETVEGKRKYVSNCLSIFVINYTVFLVVALILHFSNIWKLALPFSVLLLGELANLHLRGFLRAIKRLDIYSFANAISTVFIAVFTTILVRVLNYGLTGIILGYGIGYICGNIIIILVTKYWQYLDIKQISFAGMKGLIAYSYALIPNSIAWWLINVSDRTIINWFLGATANGIYAIAYKIPNILSAVFGVFGVSWQQSATEALNNEDRNKYYNTVYNKMVVILLSLGCGILSLNSWLFNYIFDNKYYEGYLYAPILIGGTIFATLSQFYGGIQISFKRPKENGVTTVIGAISNIIIHLVLVKMVGLFAAAISTIMSQIIVCLLRNIRLKKIVQIRLSKQSLFSFAIYIAFSISAYYITNMVFNIISVAAATVFVLYANQDIAKKLVSQLRRSN